MGNHTVVGMVFTSLDVVFPLGSHRQVSQLKELLPNESYHQSTSI
jgi:hypothetical protein